MLLRRGVSILFATGVCSGALVVLMQGGEEPGPFKSKRCLFRKFFFWVELKKGLGLFLFLQSPLALSQIYSQ
jgi:hypothetical protein